MFGLCNRYAARRGEFLDRPKAAATAVVLEEAMEAVAAWGGGGQRGRRAGDGGGVDISRWRLERRPM